MASDDEDEFCRFGTPLDPIEEGKSKMMFDDFHHLLLFNHSCLFINILITRIDYTFNRLSNIESK